MQLFSFRIPFLTNTNCDVAFEKNRTQFSQTVRSEVYHVTTTARRLEQHTYKLSLINGGVNVLFHQYTRNK